VDQTVPINSPDNILLHGFGYSYPYNVTGKFEFPDMNLSGFTAETNVPGGVWFSPLHISQTITLQDGAMTRMMTVSNMGRNVVPMSFTTHAYFKFAEGQSRSEVLVNIPAEEYIDTITPPFVEHEMLLPDFDKGDPHRSVAGSGFSGFAGANALGETYLDHFFTKLVPTYVGAQEIGGKSIDGNKFSAGFFQPGAGWGVEVSVPFISGFINSVNGVQVYSPGPNNPAASDCICFEFQANGQNGLSENWAKWPITDEPLFTPGGMRLLLPFGSGAASSMTYTVQHRMIDSI
jgi:hypothetical protein